ncbi:E3 ubiquitin-protein ligase mdm2, partial [Globisporangium splendens]
MAPPSILTHFGRNAATPTHNRNEVVIDGESSSESDEEEVMVITPQSRKRNRTSAIMDEDDDDEEQQRAPAGMTNVTPPPAKQRRVLSPRRDDDDNDDARARDARRADSEEEDDDDEVEIIQMGANATPLDGSVSKKNRRLTINDTDDDDDDEHEQEEAKEDRRRSFGATATPTLDRRTSVDVTPGRSASRRSSRIERRRQEKEVEQSSARKLEYLSLDNCLDNITNDSSKKRKANARDTDDDDFEDDDDDDEIDDREDGFFASKSGRRQKRQSLTRKEVEREGRHADGDDDLDEFIVGDNEVEYMDDDENGVISVESGSDDDVEDDEQDFAAMRAAQQTREPSEWFAIYLEYIEECIIDADLDNKMRRRQSNIQYQLYKEAIHHIERAICSRRDTLRGSVAWPDDMVACLKTASSFRTSRCDAQQECDACNRQNHMATFSAHLGGVACDATELYRENWMQRCLVVRLRKSMFVATPVHGAFEMGSVCHARTLAYWQLLHAKRFWCILVDAKRKEFSDATGRIAKELRKPFHKQEFGRYKRLLDAVDTFEMESRRSNVYMANVWKRVTPQHVQSAFLPAAKRKRNSTDSRRGTMDSFVGESDEEDEDEEDEEDEEEKEEEEAAQILNERDQNDGDDEEEEKEELDTDQRSNRTGPRTSQENQAAVKPSSKAEDVKPSIDGSEDAKPGANATEAEDLLCLVCGENPRNGGIVHGQYLHFYCCFRCGKRQFRSKMGCLVCDRPIDCVLRLLPLTQEARDSIKKTQQS